MSTATRRRIGTRSVRLVYSQRLSEYVPSVVEHHEYGCGVVRSYQELGTNAVLPAIVRARELAERLGLPCDE